MQWSLNLTHRVDMRSLRRLELCYVLMDEEVFKVLEHGCPCLQELLIQYPIDLRKLNFSAPNIERLELQFEADGDDEVCSLDCPNLKYLHIEDVCLDSLELIDVSSVTRARINNRLSSITVYQFEILHKKFQNAKFFHLRDRGGVQYVEHLDGYNRLIADKVCMLLEQCGNEELVFQQNSWSLLALKPGLQRSCLLGICRLLRSSRFLEELILHVEVDFFCNCNMLLQELSSPCQMMYLKTVTIHDFEKPCKTFVQLVEFLLKNAVVLDKLVIVCNKKDQLSSAQGVEFMLELLSLPRASQNARVVVT